MAYAHRYVVPMLAVMLPLTLSRSECEAARNLGIGAIAFALYDFIGYKLRWKHIYCSYQNAYHQKMTPERIDWRSVRKSDAYGIPLFFAAIGAAAILLSIFYIS